MIHEAVILSAIILIAGVGSWLVRPDRLTLTPNPTAYQVDLPAPLISLDDALDSYESGQHVFIDTRPDATLETAIPGAFIVRTESFGDDLARAMDFVYPEDPLILYGEDDLLPVGDVASRFLARGYANIWIMDGGLASWRHAGGPIDGELADE
jgi:3-mercaptopyruvate sulfurtransferase SseA